MVCVDHDISTSDAIEKAEALIAQAEEAIRSLFEHATDEAAPATKERVRRPRAAATIPCPDCDHMSTSTKALVQHGRNTHHLKVAEQRARGYSV
jgi:hypothetical protein